MRDPMRDITIHASGTSLDDRREEIRAATRLERSVSATLQAIAAACAERDAPPVHAARRHLAEAYGAARLRKRMEEVRRSA